MIAHTTLPVSDYKKSKAFYMQTLAPLGYKNNMESGEADGFNDVKNTDFWIMRMDTVVPTHLAFEANSRQTGHIDKAIMDQVYTLLSPEFRAQFYRESFLGVDHVLNL